MKEIYRAEKKIIYNELREKNKQILIGFIYIGNDVKPQMEILRNKIREGIEILIASSNNRQPWISLIFFELLCHIPEILYFKAIPKVHFLIHPLWETSSIPVQL